MSRLPTAAALLAAALAGCTSVHIQRTFNGVCVEGGRTPVETVEIENSGWYLFTCLPIASGDFSRPDRVSCRWFTDTVKLENNLKILDGEMKRTHVTEVANLTSHRSDEKFLVFILSRRAYHTSAVLLKPEEE